MPKHHLIISGTGRAGTTFLVQLLTDLGLDTGFADPLRVLPNCDAGLERNILAPQAPYVIKSPWLCAQLESLLDAGQVAVDHAIVPMRDLHAAAQSRRDVSRRSDPAIALDGHIPGGVWLTDDPASQEQVLAEQLYRLLYALTKHRVPTTFLLFPRFVTDPDYLFDALAPVLPGVGRARFLASFERMARPALVHDFGEPARSS